MSKSIIYVANTNSQALTSGSIINFGSIVRRYGCNLGLSGGNVTITGCGYYDTDVNLTFSGTAGTAVIQVLKDGVVIPGAEATVTIAADTNYAVSIPCIIKQHCNCEDVITVTITGVTTEVSNAAITVEKI